MSGYYNLYQRWLGITKCCEAKSDAEDLVEAVNESLESSTAYQDCLVNGGTITPLVVQRTDTNKCDVTVPTGSDLHIGDLVYVYDENWLCMELYEDEYGIKYAVLWMCNHILIYQDFDLNIIHKPAILDDGSYSSPSEKSIVVSDGKYSCYVSLDDESRVLYIDKRLALDVVLNSDGEEVLLVSKIVWLDAKSKNYGEGSHLLAFNIESDLYNPETDDINLHICDYKEKPEDESDEGDDTTGSTESGETEEGEETLEAITITGNSSLKIGTTRTYTASVDGTDECEYSWSVDNELISISYDGATASVTVPLNYDLIGETIIITCDDLNGAYTSGTKTVGVITIG